MGFFRKLVKNVKDQAMQDQSVNIERAPNTVGGAKLDPAAPEKSTGLSSLLGGTTRRKRKKNPNLEAFYNSPAYKNFQDSGGIGTMDMYTASDGSIFSSGSVGRMYEKFLKDQAASKSPPAPTGIEALIRPPRTDPGGQEDMRKLMDMQKQTFRSFLAPPPAVKQPTAPYIPIDGGDLGLPTGPGTPMPPGTIFEGEVGQIDIQDILDSLPKGVGVGGIGSIPVPDIPYEIPELTVPQELLDSISNPATIPLPTIESPIDLPIQVPPVEDFVMPSLPLELPLQLPQLEQVATPSLPLELPVQLTQLEQVATPSLPINIPQSAVDALGIGALNIQPSLPVLETKPTPVVSMPAMQAVNEVSVPKVAVDIPKYNYNDPARLARRDAYFASSRFD